MGLKRDYLDWKMHVVKTKIEEGDDDFCQFHKSNWPSHMDMGCARGYFQMQGKGDSMHC